MRIFTKMADEKTQKALSKLYQEIMESAEKGDQESFKKDYKKFEKACSEYFEDGDECVKSVNHELGGRLMTLLK